MTMALQSAVLQHVSVLSSDLERSTAFYRDVLGMRVVPRPAFKTAGVWLEFSNNQIHLIDNPHGSFRTRRFTDSADTHFALNVADFDGAVSWLASQGYREDAKPDDPMRLEVFRHGIAGFPQAYLLDPDNNIIEINGPLYGG